MNHSSRKRSASACAVLALALAACGPSVPSTAAATRLLESSAEFKAEALRVNSLRQDSPETLAGEALAPDGSKRFIFASARGGLLHFSIRRAAAAGVPDDATPAVTGAVPLGR